MRPTSLTQIVLALGLLSIGRVFPTAAQEAPHTIRFDIKPQAVNTALLEFGQQSHSDILFDDRPLIRVLRAPAVRGSYTPAGALALLLRDTGITYSWVPPNLFVFHVPKAPGAESQDTGNKRREGA